jgi:flagellar protein FlaG
MMSFTANGMAPYSNKMDGYRRVEPITHTTDKKERNNDTITQKLSGNIGNVTEQKVCYEETIDKIMDVMDHHNHITFELDKTYDEWVVNIVDGFSGELVRSIPPERLLEIQHKLDELSGILLDEVA